MERGGVARGWSGRRLPPTAPASAVQPGSDPAASQMGLFRAGQAGPLDGYDGTWLCPQPIDRPRMLEMDARSARGGPLVDLVMTGSFVVVALLTNAWALLPVLAGPMFVAFGVLKGRLRKPERFMLACLCVFAVAVSVAISRTGGKDSPLIVWVAFLSVGLAVRFAGRALLVTVAGAVLLGMAGILDYDPARLRGGAATLVAVAAACFVVSSYARAIVESEYDQRVAARVDPLTGLLNRTGLQDRVNELRQRCIPTRQPLALIVCDLDHFKQVNDELGHERGDAVLQDLAEIFRRRTRQFELVYRLGGDEFLMVLPGVDEQGAVRLAEDLRADVAAGLLGGTAVTASFGVSTAVAEQIDFSWLYLKADQALYRAKALGGNRVAAAA